jgi:hypothetical protein
MYKIQKTENKKSTQWKIIFEFEKSNAVVEITHDKNDVDLYLVSRTDGFHWFEFFMAQEPNCENLQFEERNDYLLAKEKVRDLFKNNGFIYRPENKESCFLNGINPYTDNQIETISKLIDERFANREHFF